MTGAIPDAIKPDLARARRLEWATLFWIATVIVVMGLAAGGSQAMKTAWIEDMLSLVPAAVFLIAAHFEGRPPSERYPYGFRRVNSLAFLIAAVALSSVGATLIWEAASTLLMAERPTIGSIQLLGKELWHGWAMVAALVYSVIPPVILGRLKKPVAERLQDKVLHTDALMQRADWQTGLAGIAGVVGVGLGYWWADAAAAGLIALSILKDGLKALGTSFAELIDGAPRDLEKDEIAPDAQALGKALAERYGAEEVRMRECGRFIGAEVVGGRMDEGAGPNSLWPGEAERSWRLADVSFVPRR